MSGPSHAALSGHTCQDLESQRPRKKTKPNSRACDICRQRKVRCDGPNMPANECSFCIEHEIECTYTEGKPRKAPPLSYYRKQAERAAKLELLIKQIVPDIDLEAELEKLDTQHTDLTWASVPPSTSAITSPKLPESFKPATNIVQPEDSAEQDGILLPDDFGRMHSYTARFHGKSSGALMIQNVMRARTEKTGVREDLSHIFNNKEMANLWIELPDVDFCKRKPPTSYTFPDEDLLMDLVNIYLSDVNLFSPLFHRPTLEKCLSEKLYLRDPSFGGIVLLICANASRRSDDPRVLYPDTGHSVRGWQWFEQVRLVGQSFIAAVTLQDLQTYILMAEYISSGFSPQGGWMLVGLGLRAAQDVGAHSQKMYALPLTVEKELWRRAWWILIKMDRGFASSLGRPLGIPDEEFDVELPIECDDEYWEHPDPSQAWKQPHGKPAVVSYFIQKMKLNQILGRALRTVYAIDKAKLHRGLVGDDWEPRIVAELDSSLNMWIDSLPDHLRWNPQGENTLWFIQSTMLHAEYYHLQIIVHMPFITTKESPLSFPSLAICTNAARACSHLVDPKDTRLWHCMSAIVWPVFLSAIVLLLNTWGGKKAGLELESSKALKDIRACQEVIKQCEERFKYSKRLWHILDLFTSDLDPHNNPTTSNKRTRDGVPNNAAAMDPLPTNTHYPSPSSLATDFQKLSLINVHENLLQSHFRTLPLSTNDLQRAPLFPEPSEMSPPESQHPIQSGGIVFEDESMPLRSDDNQARSFSQTMQQLPFFDSHGDWGSSVFGGMPSNTGGTNPDEMPFLFDIPPSDPAQYQGYEQLMEYDSPAVDTGWQQASHSLGHNNWEAYLSNVSELLKDIDSWERPSMPPDVPQ